MLPQERNAPNQTQQAHQRMQAPVQQNNPQLMGRKTLLTNEEFDNLKRSIQLLRIEQIRYIVQRFSLPANGNKTRLIQIILGIIDTLRSTPLLVEMSYEVSRLLQQQHEPFSNPYDSTHKMVINKDLTDFFSQDHPFYTLSDNEPIAGPYHAPVGNSTLHQTTFEISDSKNLLIEFQWKGTSSTPFDMVAHVNGTAIVVTSEDPNPQSLDISDLVANSTTVNFDIQSFKTTVPMAISIRDYTLRPVSIIAQALADSAHLTTPVESIKIKGKNCPHNESIFLIDFLSQFYSIKSDACPICKNTIELESVIFIE